eukprot:820072-Prymnesium_polylepis.1
MPQRHAARTARATSALRWGEHSSAARTPRSRVRPSQRVGIAPRGDHVHVANANARLGARMPADSAVGTAPRLGA